MKFRLLSLLVAGTAACQPQAETARQPPAAAAQQRPADSGTAPAAGARLSPVFSGYWLSSAYLQKLALTRSPALAINGLPAGPGSIYIEPFAHQTDSVEVAVNYGMHEGGSRTLLLPRTGAGNAVRVKPDYGTPANTVQELVCQPSDADTTLLFNTRHRQTNRVVGRIAYRRVLPAGVKTDLEGGVNRAVNQLLMAGRYRGTDARQRAVEARFFADGTVQGLPFKRYFVQTDFTGPNVGDEIIFDVYTKSQLNLAAAFGRDTLRLYTIDSDLETPAGSPEPTEVFRRGRLRYELIRQP